MGDVNSGILDYIRRHRRSLAVSWLVSRAHQVLRAYENANHDPYRNGEWFVLRTLSAVGVRAIFDVGANVGNWALMARRACPRATVHCFEIVTETCTRLEERVTSDPEIIPNRFGLADRHGEVVVKLYPDASHLASLFDYPHACSHRLQAYPVTTGDGYMAERGIDRVDYLKIDVEGAEGMVIDGFAAALATNRIRFCQFEYGFANILSRRLLKDLYEIFTGWGYRVGKIYPGYVEFRNYRLTDEDFLGPNFLAAAPGEDEAVRLLGS